MSSRRRRTVGKRSFTLAFAIAILSSIILFQSAFTSTNVFAQPAWPLQWIPIDWDPNENGLIDDWRDVEIAYYQQDAEYLYLKLECFATPGSEWPSKDGRYKWFVDLDDNMYHSGENIYDAEYMLFVEDADHDGLGEMYLVYDTDGDGNFADYEPWPPTNYTDFEVTDSNDGGWRIVAPNQIEMYISWASIGDPSAYCLTWATDQQNPNLDQGPTTDHVDEEVPIKIHDVAAVSQTPNATDVIQGDFVTIEVVVENQGMQTESFEVTCYFNTSIIGVLNITDLPANQNVTLYFEWNTTGVPSGTYSIEAWADSNSAIAEIDEVDNWCTSPATVTVQEVLVQYYLTVNSPYGVESGEGWYDNGTNAYAALDTGIIDHGNGTRRIFTHWSGDASGTNYLSSDPIYMDQNKTAIAIWKTQYTLSVTSPFGTPGGGGWYDSGSTAYATLDVDMVDHGNGTRRLFVSWSGDTSGTAYTQSDPILMDAPKTATANWKTQYHLALETNPSSVTTPSGEGWYDSGVFATISTDEFVDIMPNSSRYKFVNWTTSDMSEIMDPASPSTTVLMDKPKIVTANYRVQYLITFDQTGVGFDFMENILNVEGLDYGVADLPIFFWWDEGSSHSFSFYSPLIIIPNAKQYVWEVTTGLSMQQSDSLIISASGSVIGNYKTQYYLSVTSPFGTPGGGGWYDSGSTAYATLDVDMVDHGNGTRRLFVSWSGDTSGTAYTQSDPILMDAPKTATANWKTQYFLTITTTSGGTTDPNSSAFYDAETIVPVTAIPETDYVFDHWELDSTNVGSANPYNVNMDTAHTLHAVFIYTPPSPMYYLAVETDPTAVTTIPGEGWYSEDDDVSLTAPNYVTVATDARYKFAFWDVDGAPQGAGVNAISVHMDANHTATAHYILQFYLTVNTSPTGIAVIPGEGWYDQSANVSLVAPPVAGYEFLYWNVDGASQGSQVASIVVSMNSPHVATAYYAQEQVVVGGFTASINSSLLDCWIGLNIVIALAVISFALWIKRQEN